MKAYVKSLIERELLAGVSRDFLLGEIHAAETFGNPLYEHWQQRLRIIGVRWADWRKGYDYMTKILKEARLFEEAK